MGRSVRISTTGKTFSIEERGNVLVTFGGHGIWALRNARAFQRAWPEWNGSPAELKEAILEAVR